MSGRVAVDILDTDTNASVLGGLRSLAREGDAAVHGRRRAAGPTSPCRLAAPGESASTPSRSTAVSGDTSDGELRPVPLLPGRMHLVQSRFVTLHDGDRREMTFADLAKNDDPTRINEQMVVTVDAQLFYSVLQALPYLVNYPYECTEQTLNRFVSTGIVSSLFRDYPAVAKMAQELSKRDTRLETWDCGGRRTARWRSRRRRGSRRAKGGRDTGLPLSRVLDPRVARRRSGRPRSRSCARRRPQSGGFPWWPGGPPSTYMTLYILHGFANALEFGAEVPKDMVQKAWAYAGTDVRRDLDECMHLPATSAPSSRSSTTRSPRIPTRAGTSRPSTARTGTRLLDYSFAHWKLHPPYLKGQLALTLKRMGRPADAKLVWDSVMDSAKTDRDLGTYWAPEDRSWLWYNDTIETQAFALRTLSELDPAEPAAPRPGAVALPEQEAEPVEVHPRDGRGRSTRSRST